MRNLNQLSAALLGLVLTATTSFAGETGVKILSEKDWAEIVWEAEMDRLNDIDPIPEVRMISQEELTLNLRSGKTTKMQIVAPLADEQLVGLVVVDAYGNVVHNASGLYKNLRNFELRDFHYSNMVYVVRLYSDFQVFESNLQVVYPQ